MKNVVLVSTIAVVAIMAYKLYTPVPNYLGINSCHRYGIIPLRRLLYELMPGNAIDSGEKVRDGANLMRVIRDFCYGNEPDQLLENIYRDEQGREVLKFKSRDWVLNPAKTVIFLHGGGYVVDSPERYSGPVFDLVKDSRLNVLFVRYRLAPEHLFPTPVDDCVQMVRWILDNSHALKIEASQVYLMGDSAGGNLVLNVAMELLQNDQKYPIAGVHSIYPTTQVMNHLPSLRQHQIDPAGILNIWDMGLFLSMYILGDISCVADFASDNHVSVSAFQKLRKLLEPLNLTINGNRLSFETVKPSSNGECATKMENALMDYKINLILAPTECLRGLNNTKIFLYTCETDVLRDDGFLLSAFLETLGVKIRHDNEGSCYHGSFTDKSAGGITLRKKILENLDA